MFPAYREAFFTFERKFVDASISKTHLPREQGILNSAVLELFYNRKDSGAVSDHIVRDYIGPSIDNGFRISSFSTPVWMPISIELAYFISESAYYAENLGFGISRIDRQRLKGVMGERPYPVFFIDLAASSNDKFVVERACRNLMGSDKRNLEADRIMKYCESLFEDNRNYFYKPFIPVYSDSYIPEGDLGDELIDDFSNQIERIATKFCGQCELFKEWLEAQGYEADRAQDIKDGLNRAYPDEVRQAYEGRVKKWFSSAN